jgi:NADP-reducing hydrogenase subunit HndC
LAELPSVDPHAHAGQIDSCYVCVNYGCEKQGSRALFQTLQERLKGSGVAVKEYVCFGACWLAPNLVLHPDGTWYSNVQPADLDDILAHIQGGPRVERLLVDVDPKHHELLLSLLETKIG